MDPIIKKQRIASLILKEKIDELSKSEKEELTSWLQASPKNKKIYARLQEKSFSEDIARYQQISTTRGLDNYRRRYVQTNKRLLGKWYWAAAVAVFIIGIATLFFYQEEHPTVAKTTISPGSSKAMLILNNGEIISLSEKNKTEMVPAHPGLAGGAAGPSGGGRLLPCSGRPPPHTGAGQSAGTERQLDAGNRPAGRV